MGWRGKRGLLGKNYPQSSCKGGEVLVLAYLNTDLTPHRSHHKHTSLLAETGITLDQIIDKFYSDDQISRKK